MATRKKKTNTISENVFLGWSGKGSGSHKLAQALEKWLPSVLVGALPWVSSSGISAGQPWWSQLSSRLEQIRFGIFCLTSENVHDCYWILFEAGTIFKGIDESRVCAYMLGVQSPDLPGPLSFFQGCAADREGTWNLVKGINKSLEPALDETKLEVLFEKYWPEFEKLLPKVPKPLPPPPKTEPTWDRFVPRLPIPTNRLQVLTKKLEGIRNATFERLTEILSNNRTIQREDIRVAVFLPDTVNSSADGILELCIPKSLKDWGSKKESERDKAESRIRFVPGQGLTGRVFISQRYEIASAIPAPAKDKRRWPPEYGLSLEQEKLIHQDLKWILAFPLNIQVGDDRKNALGVLTIDGLTHEVNDSDLDQLAIQIIPETMDFAFELAKEKKSRISLYIEDVL